MIGHPFQCSLFQRGQSGVEVIIGRITNPGNMSVRSRWPKIGKAWEIFKKHKQVEFQKLAQENCFCKEMFDQTTLFFL